jgi:hypothetical protein
MTESLTFQSHGTRCAATLYLPDGSGPAPCLVMGHGFCGTQDQMEPYARQFAEARIAALTFDYRHFGRSEGEPRQLVDCRRQLETGERRSNWPVRSRVADQQWQRRTPDVPGPVVAHWPTWIAAQSPSKWWARTLGRGKVSLSGGATTVVDARGGYALRGLRLRREILASATSPRTPDLDRSRDGSDSDVRVARHTLHGHALLAQRLGTWSLPGDGTRFHGDPGSAGTLCSPVY